MTHAVYTIFDDLPPAMPRNVEVRMGSFYCGPRVEIAQELVPFFFVRKTDTDVVIAHKFHYILGENGLYEIYKEYLVIFFTKRTRGEGEEQVVVLDYVETINHRD